MKPLALFKWTYFDICSTFPKSFENWKRSTWLVSYWLSIWPVLLLWVTMELFKFLKSTYTRIGILPAESNQNTNPINWKNCFFLLCEGQFFISSVTFLLFEANSMIEYGMASFMCLTTLLCTILYWILFWQMKHISKFIENFERFTEQSE